MPAARRAVRRTGLDTGWQVFSVWQGFAERRAG